MKIKAVYLWEKPIRPSRLPSAYQEVEYIQSSGTQYIHTNIIPTDSTWLYMKVSSQNTSSDNVYCGSNSDNTDTNSQKFWLWNAGNKLYFWWNTWQPESSSRPSISVDTIVELENNYLNSRCMKKDWTNIVTNLATLSSNWYWINIFWHNWANTAQYFSSIKLYSLKVSDGRSIVYNFVPCYRIAGNVIWLYDKVNNVFYTNSWSGTFTKWPDVN